MTTLTCADCPVPIEDGAPRVTRGKVHWHPACAPIRLRLGLDQAMPDGYTPMGKASERKRRAPNTAPVHTQPGLINRLRRRR